MNFSFENNFIYKTNRFIALLLVFFIMFTFMFVNLPPSVSGEEGEVTETPTEYTASDFGTLLDTATQFIVIKHKQLGGSHYAYTEAVSDEKNSPMGNESNFRPGSQMVLLTLKEDSGKIVRREEVLLESRSGVLRDPDISEDGTTVLFSWKKTSNDDFHLYEMNLSTKDIKQLTFGSGIADIEPKYLPNGKIIFSSTRCIEYVDCWITPVSNMYTCDADGSNIMRLGYDQVHTTYPTVTEDGRVLYTRWDYNDRTQMFIQGVFQMFPDGTNQTEVYGNGSSFPTTLLHTREVPGSPGLYVSISSGHHTWQGGKLVLVDTSEGRNEGNAVQFVFEDSTSSRREEEDMQNQSGPIYKYPVALNDHEFLVSYCRSGWGSNKEATQFGIYYMNSETNERILISSPTSNYGASQIVPIKTRTLFERPSMVNNSVDTGTYYIGNVYEGDGMTGVEFGTAKYLRVVALEFRSSSIGATIGAGSGTSDQFSPVSTGNGSWDIKKVLGIVEIEEDGSALFKVPANTPLYFQVLNADGELIQSMRSWSTLMPNETFSCVGCHEDKNTVPPVNSSVTIAMKKGVQTLRPDLWMEVENEDTYDPAEDSEGFSYLKEVQPILDANCVSCHNNRTSAFIKVGISDDDQTDLDRTPIFEINSEWKYTTRAPGDNWYSSDFSDSDWKTGRAVFGSFSQKTNWNTSNIYLRTTFNVDSVDAIKDKMILLKTLYDENPEVYLNGTLIYSAEGYLTDYVEQEITEAFLENVKEGENLLAVSAINTGGGQAIDIGIYSADKQEGAGQISLESYSVLGEREKTFYTLSYLVLTGSTARGNQFQGTPVNEYTNWISSMSPAEILEPYQYGSTQSALIQRLKSGHGDLSDKEIKTITTWIDLCVPFKGSYDEAHNWSSSDYKEYSEKLNKREYYDMVDEVTKKLSASSGEISSLPVTVSYTDKNGEVLGSITDSGLVMLYLDSKLTVDGKVTVTLPEGVEYFFFNLNPRLSEALIYCPSGVFEYTLPSFTKSVFPSYVLSGADPIITVRLADENDLQTERNLALNPYDLSYSSVYPHASAGNTYDNDNSPEFSSRNAIDGFKVNNGHGTYPLQSWGSDLEANDLWYQIDFGKTVYVNKVAITIRADFPHDTYYNKAVLEFSDGSTQEVTLSETAETQTINIEGGTKATSYVKIQGFEKAGSEWAALSEVEVFGTVNEVLAPSIEAIEFSDGVQVTPSFSKDIYEYTLKISGKADSFDIKNIRTSNAQSIKIKVDDTDIFYDGTTGATIRDFDGKTIKIILSGNGGDVVYTFKTGSSLSYTAIVIIICVLILAAAGIAIFFILRAGNKPAPKKGPVASGAAETSESSGIEAGQDTQDIENKTFEKENPQSKNE